MNVSDKKCTYFLMDWLKFIFCLFVVGIHTDLFSENPSFRFWIDRGLFKIAVPYFALASSFLLGSKINNGTDIKQTITNYTKRMLTLLIVFEPISLVLNIVIMLLNNKEPMVIIAKTGLSILFAPPGALWYIQALVVGAWLAYPFIIKQQINFGIGLGGVLYLIGLLCNSYYYLIDGTKCVKQFVDLYLLIFRTARNGVFFGFLYILLGIKLSSLKIKYRTILIMLGTIITYVIFMFEIYCFKDKNYADGGSMFVLLPILACFFVTISTRYISYNAINTIIYRNLSTGIYLLHMPIVNTFNILSTIIDFKLNSIYRYLITISIAVILCLWSYKKNNKLSQLLK